MACCGEVEEPPTRPPHVTQALPPVPISPASPAQRELRPVLTSCRAAVRQAGGNACIGAVPSHNDCAAVTPPPTEVSFSRKPLPPGCKRFSYYELQGATGSFAENAVLGEGGFGKVYRGTLEDGTAVAIKCLDRLGLQVLHPMNGPQQAPVTV